MGRQASFGLSETEFSSLLQALSSTSKGRIFLEEYRRRFQPEDTLGLLQSMQRIEAAMAAVRDQLQPERIADELRRIAMAIDMAVDGVEADEEGDETARRFALAQRARDELETLASGFAGSRPAPRPAYEPEPDEAQREGVGYRLRDPDWDR